jgi:hypothetical protein
VLEPIDQDVETGGEPLVAVVDPDVFAEGDQGGEAVGGQCQMVPSPASGAGQACR